MNFTLAAFALSLVLALPVAARESQPELVGVASVIDGDTIDIHGARIRLNGIDAPEGGQLCHDGAGKPWRCGQQAALALSDRIGRRTVSCQQVDTDRYGRAVADCYVGRYNINLWMVRQGWAVAYRQYSTDYIEAEARARAERRGVWQGPFDMPWDWRRTQRRSDLRFGDPMLRLIELAGRSYSCSPRRTCGQIGSCEEAHWYLENCSWGGRLDRDGDGRPCESIC